MTDERFARIERLVGPDGLQRLHQAQVTVVGLGAVGSYAVEALARAGVGHLRLVDFDVVRPSNINRQLYALESTLGQPKTELARKRVLDINPNCQVEVLSCFAHVETLDAILAGPPDVLIDAIDSLNPKLELLTEASNRDIKTVSSMGAALRTDPQMIRVSPLSKTRNCPLAKMIRKRLRKREVPLDFLCVHSLQTRDDWPDEAVDREGQAQADDTLERGRRRRALGSLPTMTGIFGLTVANVTLELLLGNLWPGRSDLRP